MVNIAQRIVCFTGGLTARMGYKQQLQVAQFADVCFYSFVIGSYALGWYLQRFSYTVYGTLLCGLVCLIVMVPNWSSALQSYRAGRIVTGIDELTLLPDRNVKAYYEELREDELRVDEKRRAPLRY